MDAQETLAARGPPSNFALIAAFFLFLIVAALAAWRLTPVAPVGSDATDRFSADRAAGVLTDILADGKPHPVDSEENERVRERILTALRSYGYHPEVQETTACRQLEVYVCARVRNIIALRKGMPTGATLLVSAHYDSVAAGPGASDDGSGVAILLEVARMLRQHPDSRNGVLFLFTDGEEAGLLGAHAFATESPLAKDVSLAINVEARGTSGQSHLFETGDRSGWLVNAFAQSAAQPRTNSLLSTLYALLPNDTDLTIFKSHGVQGLNFAYGDRVGNYHTPLDSLQSLDRGSLQQQGDNVYDLLRFLIEKDISGKDHTGELVYTDLLGLGMVRWPASAGPAIVLVLLGAFVFCHRRLKRHAGTPSDVVRGALGAVISLLVGGMTAYLLASALSLIAGDAPAWHSDRTANRWLLWSCVLLAVLAVQSRLQRGRAPLGLWLGVGYSWLLAALVCALLLPGVSYLFALPCMALVAAALVFAIASKPRDAASRLFMLPALLPAVAAFVLALSTVFIVEIMLGFNEPVASTSMGMLVGLSASFVAPLMPRDRPSRMLRTGAVLLFAATLTGAIFSIRAPAYPSDQPPALNVLYVQAADGKAYLVSTSAEPPAAVAGALGRDAAMTPVFPASRDRYLAAPVTSAALPPTRLTLLRTGTHGTARTATVRIDTDGPTQRVSLLFPKDMQLRSIEMQGRTLDYAGERSGDDRYKTLHCRGVSCNGMELSLVIDNPAPATVLIQTTRTIVESAGALLQARDTVAVPYQDGDRSIVMSQVGL